MLAELCSSGKQESRARIEKHRATGRCNILRGERRRGRPDVDFLSGAGARDNSPTLAVEGDVDDLDGELGAVRAVIQPKGLGPDHQPCLLSPLEAAVRIDAGDE